MFLKRNISVTCPGSGRFCRLMYDSGIMKYALASLANLITLGVGISIGLILAPHFEKRVRAEATDFGQSPQAGTSAPVPTQSPQKITPVNPVMTAGSVGVYLVLSHHVQSDELVVNGYDMLKLQNGELQLLSRFVPASEIQKIVEDSKTNELFTVAQPPQPAANPQTPPK